MCTFLELVLGFKKQFFLALLRWRLQAHFKSLFRHVRTACANPPQARAQMRKHHAFLKQERFRKNSLFTCALLETSS